MQSLLLPVEQQVMPAHGSVIALSVVPSQSSSLLLHTSAVGPVEPLQTTTPLVHTLAPRVQVNAPGAQWVDPPEFWQSLATPVGQHAWPTHTSPTALSVWPSQLLSLPSQNSCDGPTEPTHDTAPFEQIEL